MDTDTIAAVATASGHAGVGIVRVSGPRTMAIAKRILHTVPQPRYATYTAFHANDDAVLDKGVAIYFPAPRSFTGEDVLELQAHGGQVVLDLLLREVIANGARLARPGEFSERAFLNDKIDLVQAEAIADVIESRSEAAARSAMRSLSGEFSTKIHALVEEVIRLRMYIESSIDFPDEDINLPGDQFVLTSLGDLQKELQNIINQATQGSLLRDGVSLVIVGKPNAGKSSLLNLLAGEDLAIVTSQAGTTRDVLREDILIDELPLKIIDTAGIRKSGDSIEQEGIRRAIKEIEKAHIILFLRDASDKTLADPMQLFNNEMQEHEISIPHSCTVIIANNKIDLTGEQPHSSSHKTHREIFLSIKNNSGIDLLKEAIKDIAGFHSSSENTFVARRRHLEALQSSLGNIIKGKEQLLSQQAPELLAEDLRLAQNQLGEITGEFTTDDLLGKIFSSFCIGK